MLMPRTNLAQFRFTAILLTVAIITTLYLKLITDGVMERWHFTPTKTKYLKQFQSINT